MHDILTDWDHERKSHHVNVDGHSDSRPFSLVRLALLKETHARTRQVEFLNAFIQSCFLFTV